MLDNNSAIFWLAGVDVRMYTLLVNNHMMFSSEGLITNDTSERLLSCVDLEMIF
jgi:hypothetical protein